MLDNEKNGELSETLKSDSNDPETKRKIEYYKHYYETGYITLDEYNDIVSEIMLNPDKSPEAVGKKPMKKIWVIVSWAIGLVVWSVINTIITHVYKIQLGGLPTVLLVIVFCFGIQKFVLWLAQKEVYICYDDSAESVNKETDDAEITNSKVLYCKKCGNKIDPQTKKCSGCGKQYFSFKNAKSLIPILAVSLTVSIALLITNLCLIANTRKLETKINSLNDSKTKYQEQLKNERIYVSDINMQLEEAKKELDFFETHAVIVSGKDEKHYHKYGCAYCDTESFWIYNTEAAEDEGIRRCPYCFKD